MSLLSVVFAGTFSTKAVLVHVQQIALGEILLGRAQWLVATNRGSHRLSGTKLAFCVLQLPELCLIYEI